MRFPWANVLLFLLLVLQLITGYFGFTNGRQVARWILWAHGIGAYGLIILLFWKGSIILDAFRRKSKWTGKRIAFVGLMVMLVATLLAGLLWTFYGPIYLASFSLVSIHIYLAIPLMLLLLWHSWHMRFILRVPDSWSRRLFLQSAFTAVSGVVVWRMINAAKRALDLPGADRRFTGSYETGSFSRLFPVVSWIADRPPPVDPETWRLRIDGAVRQPMIFKYQQLLELSAEEYVSTLDCTGGWYSTQVWQGVRLGRLLDAAGIREDGISVTVMAVSGYKRRFPLAEARGYLLALEVAGEPLSHGHGFPARLVAPGLRGFNWVKWATRLQVNRSNHLWQSPLPLQ